MNSVMSVHGPYTPFDKPVPVPSSLADDEPKTHICFSSEWLPVVLGALKVLCRPETWEGTDAEIRSTIASAHDLLSAYSDGCAVVTDGPNWYLELEVNSGNWDRDAWNNPINYLGSGGVPQAEYILVVWNDGLLNPDVSITGRAKADGTYVGGRVDDFFISNNSDPAGQAFLLSTLDCLGNNVVNNDFTPKHYSGDYQAFRFIAGNSTVYFLHITLRGDWTCGGA